MRSLKCQMSKSPTVACEQVAHYPRVSPSRAPVFSCAHYFQGPATQASEQAL